jgi:hypothetical protein
VGLPEREFWDMTVAEIERYLQGAVWRNKTQAQFDYTLANLIGMSVGRIVAGSSEFPPIEEVYPNLFEEEIKAKPTEEELAMTNSVNRFLEFAMKHNKKKHEEGDNE